MKKQIISASWLIITITLLMIISGCRHVQPLNHSMSVLDGTLNERNNEKIINFHVIGKGLAPETAINKGQAELMAERAAVADGYRQLAEKIRGVYVDAYMKSGRGQVDYEIIRTSTQTWLRGTEIDDIVHGNYGITEAHMSLRINFIKQNMIWWPSGIGQNSHIHNYPADSYNRLSYSQ